MEQQIKKKYAFISYNHRDIKMAKWLQRKLESYKLPTTIDNEYEDSKYLRPIFRDKTDLDSGVLSEEICKHLESSKYLIVICSANSSEAKWVSAEVEYFIKDLNRFRYVIPFVIDVKSESGKETEHFPLYLRKFIIENPTKELLGVNTDDGGRDMAFIRVVSRMLCISFDELWKRHERERRKRIAAGCITTPIVLAVLYYFIIPITVLVKIKDERHQLIMPAEGIVTVNHVEYRINKFDTILAIRDIPGYYRGRNIPVSFSAQYYKKMEMRSHVGIGIHNECNLALQRDSSKAIFAGTIIDGQQGVPIRDALIEIEDVNTRTDSNGYFRIYFPVEKQTMEKAITITHPAYKKYERNDEHPQKNLGYILTKR